MHTHTLLNYTVLSQIPEQNHSRGETEEWRCIKQILVNVSVSVDTNSSSPNKKIQDSYQMTWEVETI